MTRKFSICSTVSKCRKAHNPQSFIIMPFYMNTIYYKWYCVNIAK